jgi:hypothetical protein
MSTSATAASIPNVGQDFRYDLGPVTVERCTVAISLGLGGGPALASSLISLYSLRSERRIDKFC